MSKCLRLPIERAGRGLIGACLAERTPARPARVYFRDRDAEDHEVMTAIGIDTHKATLAACAVDELGRALGEATFANNPDGHQAFIGWARSIAADARAPST